MNEDRQTRLVRKLYCSRIGRVLLKLLTRPSVSKAAGKFMDSPMSKRMIRSFIVENGIDMEQFVDEKYESFNDFFTRKVKPECRPISMKHNDLIAPCDGYLSVYPINEHQEIEIKGITYCMEDLTRNFRLAQKYRGGQMLVFRLTVSDYHRYHYPDSGIKTENTVIDGVLHTVHPVAAERRNIYKENAREHFTLHTDNFRDILMMQVGALLVGRIHNKHQSAIVQRGFEAGWFDYGGSTVVLCLEKGVAEMLPDIMRQASQNNEVSVKMGQTIGRAIYE